MVGDGSGSETAGGAVSGESLHLEIRQFLIDTLGLEDVTSEEIDVDMPLFGDGLGLDSVDALELGVALQKRYGVKVDPKADDTRRYFRSVRALSELVARFKSPA